MSSHSWSRCHQHQRAGKMLTAAFLSVVPLCVTGLVAPYSLDADDDDEHHTMRTDVAVVGGGSSGTYTAVRLKYEGYSVMVVDRKLRLWGHAETYTDPVNNYTIDTGVIVFGQRDIVKHYFKRFDVPLVKLSSGSGERTYVNPTTGKVVPFTPPDSTAMAATIKTYSKQLAKYPSIQNGFDLKYPVAKELLEPFGTFLTKYKLDAVFPLIYSTNQGYVPILQIPTLYMLKYLNPGEIDSIRRGYLTTKNHNVAALYDAAAKYLGRDSLLLSSNVVAMNRTRQGVGVLVKTPFGTRLVMSKNLVSAVPPILNNLKGYDLFESERGVFGQFHSNSYVTSVLNNTGLQADDALTSLDPSRPFNVSTMSNPYGFSINAGINLTQIYYASERPQSDSDAKAGIIASLKRAQKTLGIEERGGDFLFFSNHAPFNLMVSPKAIQGGFYKKLDALNGQKSTYWTGAAFESQDSSALWDYTEKVVLPRILNGLKGSA